MTTEREYQRVAPYPGAARFASPPLEAILGEAMTFRHSSAPTTELTGSVLAAPLGSSAEWSGDTFEPDVAGVYLLALTDGGLPILPFRVVAYHAAALDAVPAPRTGGPRLAGDKRRILRNLAAESHDFAALTPSAPLPVGVPLPL